MFTFRISTFQQKYSKKTRTFHNNRSVTQPKAEQTLWGDVLLAAAPKSKKEVNGSDVFLFGEVLSNFCISVHLRTGTIRLSVVQIKDRTLQNCEQQKMYSFALFWGSGIQLSYYTTRI